MGILGTVYWEFWGQFTELYVCDSRWKRYVYCHRNTHESTANAISKELANAEAAKRLIEASEIEPALRAWAAQGSNAVLSAGERIMEAIESKHGIQLEDDDVMGHLRTALRDIAGFPKAWAQGRE